MTNLPELLKGTLTNANLLTTVEIVGELVSFSTI